MNKEFIRVTVIIVAAFGVALGIATPKFLSERAVIRSTPDEVGEYVPIPIEYPSLDTQPVEEIQPRVVTPLEETNVISSHVVDGKTLAITQKRVDTYYEAYKFSEKVGSEYQPVGEDYSWVSEYITDNTYDFWFETESELLYLFSHDDNTTDSILTRINYSDSTSRAEETIDNLENGVYESKRFKDYYSDENSFLLLAFGGDSCAGWGNASVYNLDSKENKQFVEFGAGCSDENRYLGYYDGRLIMGESVNCAITSDSYPEICISSIYSVNPLDSNNDRIVVEFEEPYLYDVGYLSDDADYELDDNEIVIAKKSLVQDDAGYDYISDDEMIFDLDTLEFKSPE